MSQLSTQPDDAASQMTQPDDAYPITRPDDAASWHPATRPDDAARWHSRDPHAQMTQPDRTAKPPTWPPTRQDYAEAGRAIPAHLVWFIRDRPPPGCRDYPAGALPQPPLPPPPPLPPLPLPPPPLPQPQPTPTTPPASTTPPRGKISLRATAKTALRPRVTRGSVRATIIKVQP